MAVWIGEGVQWEGGCLRLVYSVILRRSRFKNGVTLSRTSLLVPHYFPPPLLWGVSTAESLTLAKGVVAAATVSSLHPAQTAP